ncbi:MAG TPA: hypothetical protein DEO85_05135 [Maritimibacter sp.]|nr:hypothetical protein [Maritimibacter sp.]
MRGMFTGLALAITLPLAGCFDANVSADFTDTDEVKLDAIMIMGAEIYQMVASTGEDPCEDGEGTLNDDGTYTCAMYERRSLDELLAAMDEPDNELGIGDGVHIEEVADGNIFISFDLSEMTKDMPPAEERAQMSAMFGDAFDGHAMRLSVVAQEIIETNGTLSDDGTTATLEIPLNEMFSPEPPDLPDSFDVTLVPGS